VVAREEMVDEFVGHIKGETVGEKHKMSHDMKIYW
jgi:hypothetical protein